MRSLLFIPGDSDKKLSKASATGADAVIYDLEDAVAPANKPAARTLVHDTLKAGAGGARQIVRINALDTGIWREDLDAVMPAGPDLIMLPKSRSAEDVLTVARTITKLEKEHGLASGKTAIIAIATETAASVFTLGTYAGATPRLAGMTWGNDDLAADIGATTNRDGSGRFLPPYEIARSLCLMAAVAAEVQPIDGMFADFRDDQGLEAACREAVRDGFTGKLAIHPAQVPIINRAFTPSPDEIAEARDIVGAFAQAPGSGVISYNGRMLDRPHLRQAERILERAKLAGEGASG